jgi:hypothetical protein
MAESWNRPILKPTGAFESLCCVQESFRLLIGSPSESISFERTIAQLPESTAVLLAEVRPALQES